MRGLRVDQVEGMYLGTWATVADAEAVGEMMAWEDHGRIALESQGVIQRIWNLHFMAPRSWVEETLKVQMQRRPRILMWVKGHQGEEGNEKADRMAKQEVEMGWRMQEREVATLAGIRQAYIPDIYTRRHLHI